MGNRLNLTFAVPAACILLASVLAAGDNTDLKQLMDDVSNLQLQYAKATKVKKQLETAKQTISGGQRALTNATTALRDETIVIDKQGSGHDSQTTTHNNRCEGTSDDQAFVAGCNSEGAKLNTWRDQLVDKLKNVKKYAEQLKQEQDKFSQATLEWAQKKSNNADFEALDAASNEWRQRYSNFLFNSPTYQRLVQTEVGSRQCRKEASLEEASQCLQWLWDGARHP